MIVCKCPLRISLAGGSSDLEEFIEAHGYGAVISFTSNLYVYTTLFCDKNGYNKNLNNYIVSYTKEEKSKNIKSINNDVARECLIEIPTPPVKISFNAEIFSNGSGLAASSAYTAALIKSLNLFNNKNLSDLEICETALRVERKFNPLTGRQDPYGCGIAGLKKLEFFSDNNLVHPLQDDIFKKFNMHLIYTGVKRKSTKVLKSVDLKKVEKLLDTVELMESCIKYNKVDDFLNLINEGWQHKKQTSPLVVDDLSLRELDSKLDKNKKILTHRLCGAGGGGYFLSFSSKEDDPLEVFENFDNHIIPINIDSSGISYAHL